MKIKKLKMKNLNSLVGEKTIDFTHEAFETNSIFAIIGPTGSGKSTILDAICLALYGETPRLGKITQSGNEIMSRHTGECAAELIFEIRGEIYQTGWSHHRARNKADGALQLPRHEIAHYPSGEIIESKLSATRSKIEEITGLDFNRFNRSMMLAQGSFAAFLDSGDKDKSEILEQITGTAIYGEISKKVHEKYTAVKQETQFMKGKLGVVSLLTAEEKKSLAEKITELTQNIKDISDQVKEVSQQITQNKSIQKLTEAIANLEERQQEFQKRKKDQEKALEILPLAEKAMKIKPLFDELQRLEGEINDIHDNLKVAEDRKPEVEQQFSEQNEKCKNLRKELKRKTESAEKMRQVISQVRLLDRDIEKIIEEKEQKTKKHEELQTKSANYKKEFDELYSKLEQLKSSRKEIEEYLENNKNDKSLIENFGKIESKVDSIQTLQEKITNTQKQINKKHQEKEKVAADKAQLTSRLDTREENIDNLKTQISQKEEAQKELLQNKKLTQLREDNDNLHEIIPKLQNLSDLIAEQEEQHKNWQSLKTETEQFLARVKPLKQEIKDLENSKADKKKMVEQLEKIVHQQDLIKSLSEHRRDLHDGEPCPLCGSREHPYIREEISAPDKERQELGEAKAALESLAKELSQKEQELSGLESKISEKAKQEEHLKQQISKSEETIEQIAENLEIEEILGDKIQALIKTKETIRDNNKNTIQAVEKLQEEIKRLETDKDKAQQEQQLLTEKEQKLKYLIEGIQQEINNLEKSEEPELLERQQREFRKLTEVYAVDYNRNYNDILVTLENRKKTYQGKISEQEKLTKQKTEIDNQIAVKKTEIKNIEAEIAGLTESIEDLKQQEVKLTTQRKEKFHEKNPDVEEAKLNNELNAISEKLNKLEQERNRSDKELEILKERMLDYSNKLSEKKKSLAVKTSEFDKELTQKGFADKKDFKAVLIGDEEIEKLRNMRESLKLEDRELKTSLIGKKKELDEIAREDLKKLSVLEPRQEKLEQELDDLKDRRGALRRKLEEDKEKRKNKAALAREFESQKQAEENWAKLHRLIGSADGKKFSAYAQGLTFQVMIHYANEQLQKMNDRYFLVRDNENPLQLLVIDNYQAGITRPTSTLSGGESFIVSLALALGLSNMASENVRIDSLFLDEGFGTLDENALEMALETLHELHNEGKLIGIISHVTALKERIPVQLEVLPQSGGKSKLQGPGVENG